MLNYDGKFKLYLKKEKKLIKRLKRESEIIRYEKEMAWKLVHIDLHKRKNIKWEDPKKKKYMAWIIDDATRLQYWEVLSDKKAKTLAWFIKRAYASLYFWKKLCHFRGITFVIPFNFICFLKRLYIIRVYTVEI